jgi:hypothetical protein
MVEITIVGRGSQATPITDPEARQFTNMQGAVIYTSPADGFVRRMLKTRVYCRNNFPK